MRRNQYNSEKRRKELDRKKKQEEKRQKKLERRTLKPEDGEGAPGTSDAQPPADQTEAQNSAGQEGPAPAGDQTTQP